MCDIKNIAVVGSGQFGSRHLQALDKITMPVRIEVVDPIWENII